MKRYPTYKEWRAAWNKLTNQQQMWVRTKAQWEHMSVWKVMNEWSVPERGNR